MLSSAQPALVARLGFNARDEGVVTGGGGRRIFRFCLEREGSELHLNAKSRTLNPEQSRIKGN